MELKRWSIATLLMGVVGCTATNDQAQDIGDGTSSDPATAGSYEVGDAVDLDGDGDADDGIAVDSNNDGVADGVDTNNDGVKDANLPGGATAGSGGGNTSTNGSTPGTGTTGNQNGNCKEYAVRNERVTPDMLIVLDKSGSMEEMAGPTSRWDGSVDGLKTITADLDAAINFGLMTYPIESNQCGAGMIDVPIASMNAAAISSKLDSMMPNGGTPTSLTLAEAHKQLKAAPIKPDGTSAAQFVLLVTDGAPNCLNTGIGGGGGGFNCNPFDPNFQQCLMMAASQFDSGAVDATVKEIDSMAKDGIKTYVLGFGTKSDAQLGGALDKMAAAGGTGDTKHRPIEDKASIVQAFKEIAGRAISCNFVLEEAPPMPNYVLVKVDGKQVNLNDPNGWVLSGDGKQVQIQGSSCASLQDGKEHLLTVEVKCELVTVE